MVKVVAYVKDYCPYCKKALGLFAELGQGVEVIDIGQQPERRDEMITKANGGTTVPQIFINDQHIGGCDDTFALHGKGALEPLLK